MRTTAIMSAVVLSAGLVAGCGGGGDGSSSGSSDYCKDLKAAKADFGSLDSSSPDFDKFDDALNRFHELADEAPSDVDADWKKLDGALTTLEKALDDAGLTVEDLGKISSGQLPEGVSQEDLTELAPKLQNAFGPDVEKASDAITKHAKSKCGVDLDE
jgi:predicted small secreted protein